MWDKGGMCGIMGNICGIKGGICGIKGGMCGMEGGTCEINCGMIFHQQIQNWTTLPTFKKALYNFKGILYI